uniref:Peptidase M3A/M3B catalytic domain-containing protein n=1 Tax=Globodera pallida TaxID=36090 RepID=A0A183BM87_GLOPA
MGVNLLSTLYRLILIVPMCTLSCKTFSGLTNRSLVPFRAPPRTPRKYSRIFVQIVSKGCLVQDSGVKIPIEHRYLLKNAPPRALALLSKGLSFMRARLDNNCGTSFKTQRIDLNNSQNVEELRHNTLLQRFRPVFSERFEGAWKMYAEEQEERIISDLQAFDLFYICRREAEHYFNVDTLAMMKHFPVLPTFEKMLQMSSELFNIEFTDITGDESFGFERCDPSVRIFDVTDKAKNDRVGFLYVDIFSRPNKRLGRGHWASLHGRPANQSRSLDTLVYVLGGHPQVGPGSLLHHDELNFDANDFMPAFMQFCMYKPRILELLSSPNVQTGKPLGIEAATNCAKALQRAAFWDSYRVLFWTDFDLTIHNMHDWRKKFWLDLYKQMYSEYFPTFKEHNYQPCSFISVFGYPSWSGLYYRKLWSEMCIELLRRKTTQQPLQNV